MRNLPSRQDAGLDKVLSGSGPLSGRDDALVAFVHQVRQAALSRPAPAVEDRHLSAMVEASQLFVEKGDPVVRPASKAEGPDFQASGLPKRRRKTVLSSIFATLTAKLAAGGVAVAMAATGGLAATGELPAPAQDAVAMAAEVIGIDLPTSDEETGDVVDDVTDVVDDVTDVVDDEVTDVVDEVDDGTDGETGEDTNTGNEKSAAVHAAIDSTEPGPERGQAVSEAASGKPHPNSDGTPGNAPAGNGTGSAVQDAIGSTEPGPERGKAVSEAARGGGDVTDGETEVTQSSRGRGR